MVKEILAHLPGVQLTLLAYYPVNHEAACDDSWFFYRTNERICEANEAVKALSQKYSLGFLDLNAPLMDEKGRLKAEFTIDATDRTNLLTDIINTLGQSKINILNIHADTIDTRAIINLKVTVENAPQLKNAFDNLKKVNGIYEIKRIIH